jgi:hypothetical protein
VSTPDEVGNDRKAGFLAGFAAIALGFPFEHFHPIALPTIWQQMPHRCEEMLQSCHATLMSWRTTQAALWSRP